LISVFENLTITITNVLLQWYGTIDIEAVSCSYRKVAHSQPTTSKL